MQFLEEKRKKTNKKTLCFNLRTDPERGGRELSIAHKIRAETCRKGSYTPLQVSGNEVKVVDYMGRPLAIPGILV